MSLWPSALFRGTTAAGHRFQNSGHSPVSKITSIPSRAQSALFRETIAAGHRFQDSGHNPASKIYSINF